jgi:hypothetical protein
MLDVYGGCSKPLDWRTFYIEPLAPAFWMPDFFESGTYQEYENRKGHWPITRRDHTQFRTAQRYVLN